MANPKLSTLVDGFTTSAINTVRWAASTAGQYALDTARDLVTLNLATAANTFYGFGSGPAYDATGSSLYAQVWPVTNGSSAASFALKLDAGSNNAISLVTSGDGAFIFRITTGGVFANTPLPAYDPAAHRWWRLAESAGTFRADVSPDGQTWTTLASAPYAFDVTAVHVYFQTGTSTTQPAGIAAGIAHVNTLAGGGLYPKVTTLQEPFTGATLNTSVWTSATVGQYTLDTVNDQFLLNVGTAAGTYYSLGSAGPYDATGSVLYAQVTPPPIGNGGITVIMKLDAGSGNAVQVLAGAGGYLALQVQRNGTYASATGLPAYDPHAHRWWRLTESASAFIFAVSADGWTWTDLATMSYVWPFTACMVYFQTGTASAQPSGLYATIAHINTPLGGPLNPNWPTVEDAWAPAWGANAGAVPLDRYVDVSNRTQHAVDVNRGRQYELDQVRAGEASLTLRNTDAALAPTNSGGPWYGHIDPYQPYRRRAQWPPSRNLLTQVQATGGDLGGYPTGPAPDDAGLVSGLGPVNVVASSSAWRGGAVFDIAVAAGAVANSVIVATGQPAVEPGITYTHTMQVRNIAASGSLQVKPYIAWYTAGSTTPTYVDGGTITLTGSTSAGWTSVTLTAAAPVNAAGMEIGLRTVGESSDAHAQVDGWQLERGTVASAWTCPGVWEPVYGGFVERWPSSWDLSGTYGTVQPTAVDTFALLSQVTLDDPLTEEINASGLPRFLFKLDDPAGSTTAADSTGNYPAAKIAASKYGAGSLTFGNEITASDPVGGVFTGSTGPVVTLNNASPGTSQTAAATFLKLASSGITGPANPGLFTRVIAFRYTGPTPTAAACMWSAMDSQRANGGPSGSRIYLYLFTGGKPYFFMTGPDGAAIANLPCGTTNCVDGNWHLLTIGFDSSHGWVTVSLDGASTTYTAVIGARPTGIVGDNLGAFVDITVGNGTTWNWQGDLAFAGEWPTLLDSTQISNLYQAWKTSCAGESTGARYARILRYGGYTGPSVLEPGLTTSMGPATIAGQDVVSALQAVADTENGEHFVDRAGVIRFKSRGARYNATAPAVTFGERVDLGEWPYEDVATDFDPTHLSNDVEVTQQPTGQVFYATDAASSAAYFPRTLTRTINSTSADECQDAANYLLSRYRKPVTRISSLKVHPSAMPGLWPACLALELGTRIRVMRRPPGAPTIQLDVFVEQLQWDFEDSGEAWLTIQCSPADTTPYAVLVPWYAAVSTTVAAGVNTITVLNRRDNTNPLAAQIAPGQQLVLGIGTSNQETVTVQSVGGTSPGWTSATITFTTSTSKPHSANETVSEPLPAGVTDPTTWDAAGRFDAVAFAY